MRGIWGEQIMLRSIHEAILERTLEIKSEVGLKERSVALRCHDDLDAALFFAIEDVESLRGIIQFHAMSHHKARVDVPVGDAIEKGLEVTLCMSLPGLGI